MRATGGMQASGDSEGHGKPGSGNGAPFDRIAEYGFVSGTSRHADRIAAIRDAHARFGVVVDPHTADGLHVAARWRDADVPMICLETAQPAKFADTIREALDIDPPRPPAYENIEARAQRFSVMPPDVSLLKRYIAERCAGTS